MRARRNGARIMLVLIGALGIAGMAFFLIPLDPGARVALPAQAFLTVVATVLMFLPAAGAWFRHHRG